MDPKWVPSIFVVSLYELDQITEMQIERARVRLHCPMLGVKNVFGQVIIQEGQ